MTKRYAVEFTLAQEARIAAIAEKLGMTKADVVKLAVRNLIKGNRPQPPAKGKV